MQDITQERKESMVTWEDIVQMRENALAEGRTKYNQHEGTLLCRYYSQIGDIIDELLDEADEDKEYRK